MKRISRHESGRKSLEKGLAGALGAATVLATGIAIGSGCGQESNDPLKESQNKQEHIQAEAQPTDNISKPSAVAPNPEYNPTNPANIPTLETPTTTGSDGYPMTYPPVDHIPTTSPESEPDEQVVKSSAVILPPEGEAPSSETKNPLLEIAPNVIDRHLREDGVEVGKLEHALPPSERYEHEADLLPGSVIIDTPSGLGDKVYQSIKVMGDKGLVLEAYYEVSKDDLYKYSADDRRRTPIVINPYYLERLEGIEAAINISCKDFQELSHEEQLENTRASSEYDHEGSSLERDVKETLTACRYATTNDPEVKTNELTPDDLDKGSRMAK